jgi:hypothetical protein
LWLLERTKGLGCESLVSKNPRKVRLSRFPISYYETEAGFPPSPAVIDLAGALHISTDELLGVKPPKVERIHDDSEARRTWKRFQMVATLPERDQKAVIRLINSLVGVSGTRRARAG